MVDSLASVSFGDSQPPRNHRLFPYSPSEERKHCIIWVTLLFFQMGRRPFLTCCGKELSSIHDIATFFTFRGSHGAGTQGISVPLLQKSLLEGVTEPEGMSDLAVLNLFKGLNGIEQAETSLDCPSLCARALSPVWNNHSRHLMLEYDSGASLIMQTHS